MLNDPDFYLEYSLRQEHFHVTKLRRILAYNLEACRDGRRQYEWLIIWGPATWDACMDMMPQFINDFVKKRLDKRKNSAKIPSA